MVETEQGRLRMIPIGLKFLLPVALCFTSCKTIETMHVRKAECPSEIIDLERFSGKSHAFLINTAEIRDAYLQVTGHYYGGCGDADFDLVWTGNLHKGKLPTANMKIFMLDQDTCKTQIELNLCFKIDQINGGKKFRLVIDGVSQRLIFNPL
jgi:hypothetical protein